MTQRQISHPESLPVCSVGHSARHILDLRGLAAGGGHFIECRCRHTRKHAEPDAAIAEWRRVNRPTRLRRAPEPAVVVDNLVQMRLPGLAVGNAASPSLTKTNQPHAAAKETR